MPTTVSLWRVVFASICIFVSSISFGGPTCRYTPSDFDGDGKSDLSLIHPKTADWKISLSGGGERTFSYGAIDLFMIPIIGDFDSDGREDHGVFIQQVASWIAELSKGGELDQEFGQPYLSDVPLTADFDGDCKTDLATFRPETAEWRILLKDGSTRMEKFGTPGAAELPVPADYDGDGKADLAVFQYETARWKIQNKDGTVSVRTFGQPDLADLPAPADYDGDGIADLAVFSPKSAQWTIRQSTGKTKLETFGEKDRADYPLRAPIGSLKRLEDEKKTDPTPDAKPDPDPKPPVPDDGYDWKKVVQFSEIPVVNRMPGNTYGSRHLEDIWTHARRQERPSSGAPPSNWGHETLHYLHAEQESQGKSFVYFEEGKGIHYVSPSAIYSLSRNLPGGARQIAASRYATYSNQCGSRTSRALACYFDEFRAYIGTSQIAIENYQSGQRKSGQDAVDGSMDFVYFGSSILLAADQADNQLLTKNPQLKATFAMLVERAMHYIDIGLTIPIYSDSYHARALKDHFINSPENKILRAFLVRVYGAPWTLRVFGFDQ